jgi:hypothetical protein
MTLTDVETVFGHSVTSEGIYADNFVRLNDVFQILEERVFFSIHQRGHQCDVVCEN